MRNPAAVHNQVGRSLHHLGVRAEDERDFVQYVQGRILPLRRTAYRLCGDWHYAHDLVQTALIQLYRHWRHVSAVGAMDAYVRKMLVNVFLEEQRRWWARKVRPLPAMPDQPAADGETPDDHLDLKAALARADIMFVINSHETFLGLTLDSGWSIPEFKAWLYLTLTSQLLPPGRPLAKATKDLSYHEFIGHYLSGG